MTQHEHLAKVLRVWTSPLDALKKVGTMKLSSRVGEMRRAGYEIQDRWQEANGKRFKCYRLKAKTVTCSNK